MVMRNGTHLKMTRVELRSTNTPELPREAELKLTLFLLKFGVVIGDGETLSNRAFIVRIVSQFRKIDDSDVVLMELINQMEDENELIPAA